jgi:hypothetical protein
LTNGYILTFFSEFLFYGQFNDPGTPPPSAVDLLLLWGVYSLMAYIVLTLIRCYRVASSPALLLVGAAYGWLLEGGVVATVYEDLPLSLCFTGLAWHMPVTVLFGWYFIQNSIRRRPFAFNLCLASLSGLLWGLWAVWPVEVTGLRPAWFTAFALGTVGLLLGAYWLNARLGLPSFQPRRSGAVLAGILFLGLYLTETALSAPLSLVLLPLLVGVCWWALRRNLRAATALDSPDLLETLADHPRAANLLAWLAFPSVAAAEYSLWAAVGWVVPSAVIGYLITVPLGFGLFIWALWRIGGRVPSSGVKAPE